MRSCRFILCLWGLGFLYSGYIQDNKAASPDHDEERGSYGTGCAMREIT